MNYPQSDPPVPVNNPEGLYARVVFPVAVDQAYTYAVPDKLKSVIAPGMRVLARFSRKKTTGFVLSLESYSPVERPSELIDCLDLIPVFSAEMIRLAQWIADYYIAPAGMVLQSMLPPGIHQESEILITLRANIGEFEINAIRRNKPVQAKILNALAVYKRLSLVELENKIKSVSIKKHLSDLERMGIVSMEERIGGQEVSVKTEKYVELSSAFIDEPERFEALSEKLRKRSPKQVDIVSALYEWTLMKTESGEDPAMRQSDLLAQTGTAAATLNLLAEKNYVTVTEREMSRDPFMGEYVRPKKLKLNEDQQNAVDAIREKIESGQYHTFLLHGVTGSGKTQVYIEAIKTALDRGQSAIVLVPEISLTPQAVERFRSHFPDEVTVWHSRMSMGERFDVWRKIHAGKARIVIGARSAVFSPVRNPGLIVVDEEHESTYKQTDLSPRYHARDVAVMRSVFSRAVVVLGSATPSVESYYNAVSGKYTLLEMPKRIRDVPMPEVDIVDMREEKEAHTEGWIPVFSRSLREKIQNALRYHQQIILFQNRRGYATYVQCFDCGFVAECPNCSISLTHHTQTRKLRCHYCGHAVPEFTECPQCHNVNLLGHGVGTQRVEELLRTMHPKHVVLRMDLDTTSKKGSHHRILDQFKNREASILLGTQMITKGLDFENVTVVGVISADTTLLLPDFRSSERTFQLLTQVAGRAGRKEKLGRVVVQTYNPERAPILYAQKHDFKGFYQDEIAHRQELMYPPFGRLIVIVFKHTDPKKVVEHCQVFSDILRALMTEKHWASHHAVLLGPASSPIGKIRNQYRWQILIKINKTFDKSGQLFRALIMDAERKYRERITGESVHHTIEIDPNHLL